MLRGLTPLLLLLMTLPAPAADVVRLRSPEYQKSLSDLHEAEQALKRTIRKVRDSGQSPIANVNYQRLLADLRAIEGELNKVIEPHTYADKHRVLQPDSMYFLPPELTPGAGKK